MEKRRIGITKAISWLILLYILILFSERGQSLFRAAAENGWFPTLFDAFANLTVAGSMVFSIVFLIFFNRSFFISLFSPIEPDYSALTVACGFVLVSGMVHTEFTIPGIQFAAYGALIVAMILRAALLNELAKSRFRLWYSLCYLTVFSMAIPVVYPSSLPNAALFHLIEANVMLLLVLSFTVMLRRLFLGDGENLLLWLPFLIMLVGDAVVLWMRWTEEINFFVLIFAALSAVMFIVGKILFFALKPRTPERNIYHQETLKPRPNAKNFFKKP